MDAPTTSLKLRILNMDVPTVLLKLRDFQGVLRELYGIATFAEPCPQGC